MNYVDSTLLKLADPAQRGGVFDDVACAQLLSAMYDTTAMSVAGPFSAIFDRFELGVPVGRAATLDGYVQAPDGSNRIDARFRLDGLFDASPIRVDALWQGRIGASVALPASKISGVAVRWPDPAGVDAKIVAALGALPADPVALEAQRRAQYMNEIEAAMNQPAALTDAVFDSLLQTAGARSVADVMATAGNARFAAAQLSFSDPGQPQPSVALVPLSAALMIVDAGFSIADLLMQTKIVRDRLEPLGLDVTVDAAYPLRAPFLVAWIVPAAVFNDSGWPGASPALRIGAAGSWLADEGIGLVVTA
jgi:hypothetical protein